MRKASRDSLRRRVFVLSLALLCGALIFSSARYRISASSVDESSAIPDLGVGASLHGKRLFPANNAWNQDISRAPVDPNSATYINSMGAGVGLHPDFGTVYAGAPNGIPYVVVAGTQPRVPINFTAYGDQSDPGPYPVPPNAPIEGGPSSTGDRHVLVIDRDAWKLYEMFTSVPINSGTSWNADSGAVFDLNSNALRPAGWTSADAAGLPIFPGLVRYDEVFEQHEIKHALRFTAASTRRAYIYPARHFASSNTSPSLPPMGLRVRLKASFNLLTFSPAMQVVLTAMKKYGMILADNGSNWYVSGSPDMRWSDDELHTLGALKGSDFEVVQAPAHLLMPQSDFDGDGKTDLAVFRPSSGNWFTQSSSNGAIVQQQFGVSTDKLAPGDYDGDGLTDTGVFRDGAWFMLQSSDGALRAEQFGTSGDAPVASDFDGDGKTDLAVFRQGVWYIRQSSNNTLRVNSFGLNTDAPVPADYDGDGVSDIAVFRASSGTWYIRQSSNNTLRAQTFGAGGDAPVAGDYDGDGKADLAIFRPSNGTWYILNSQSGALRAQAFGLNTDKPAPGDYDGDFKFDLAIFRPSSGGWYIFNSYSNTLNAQ
ncbi:MAG: VCBS repeat-containing protein, partial [Acidobacteria bacterium]|nr:VCBS repeat-containing protein [Acidobacteriota bacterium]